MRNRTLRIAALAAALAALPAFADKFRSAPERGVRDTYIVVLKDGVARKAGGPSRDLPTVAEAAQSLGRGHGGQVQEVWEDALHGFVVRMPEARARKLAEDPRVVSVEQSFAFSAPVGDCYYQGPRADTRSLPSSTLSPQTLICSDPDPLNDTHPTNPPLCQDNWGLDRIDQTSFVRDERYNFVNTAGTVHIYVMDTGIRWSHREFQDANGVSRVSGGADARENPVVAGNASNTDDCYGHGTHVAGIAAGRTYGVAKNARLHPVRVLGCPDDDTTVEDWIRGLNWIIADVAANRITHGTWPSVINWSGGNGPTVVATSALQTVVQNVLTSNITLVQSSGNQSPPWNPALPAAQRDACQYSFGGPLPDVIVAGGMDYYEGRWIRRRDIDPVDAQYTASEQGANGGACVDIWAPAAHVVSSNRTGDNMACRLSGTSMAAPHVAGAAAIYLQSNPSATPAEVEAALRSRGTWGSLQTSTASQHFIGLTSDNVVLFADTRSTGDTAPVATLTHTCPGRQCNFDALASDDDGTITSYTWAFGDGATDSGATVQHTFPAGFQGYTVLKVTDNTGKTDHLQQYIEVNSNAPPVASFTFSCTGRACTFDSSGSSDDQPNPSRTWTFGDATTGSGTAPSHTYATNGTFVVTLTVTDAAGQTGKHSQNVAVDLSAPTNTVATAAGATVTIAWTPASGADGYNVERKVSSSSWQLAQSVNGGSTSSVNDTPVSASGVVLYRVIARFGASVSPPGNNDVAYVGPFTDLPLVSFATVIKAEHVTQMRRAVNGLLDIGGQAPVYSAAEIDPDIVRGQTVQDEHFEDLMDNLIAARTAVGLPPGGFSTPPAQGGIIYRTQMENLRAGVQ